MPGRVYMISFVAAFWIAAAAAGSQGAAPTVSAGLYTAAQAERGLGEYTTACAHCHRSDLLGDERREVPSLAEESFFLRWQGRPLRALYEMIRKDMPGDKPGALKPQAYADIVAYILQVNRYPAGTEELGADPAALANVVIEKQ